MFSCDNLEFLRSEGGGLGVPEGQLRPAPPCFLRLLSGYSHPYTAIPGGQAQGHCGGSVRGVCF